MFQIYNWLKNSQFIFLFWLTYLFVFVEVALACCGGNVLRCYSPNHEYGYLLFNEVFGSPK